MENDSAAAHDRDFQQRAAKPGKARDEAARRGCFAGIGKPAGWARLLGSGCEGSESRLYQRKKTSVKRAMSPVQTKIKT